MVSTEAVIAIEWIFMTLTYIFVIARIYVRICLRKTSLSWAEGWLVIAVMSAQGLLICDTITYAMGGMTNFGRTSEAIGKIRFATNYFFDVGIYFPKFSIIALYYMVVPRAAVKMRIALYILTAITVSSALFTLIADTFWCGTKWSNNWLVNVPFQTATWNGRRTDGIDNHRDGNPHTCTIFSSMDLMRANWALNFSTELLNILYPFPLISSLKLSTRQEKASLAIIFGMSAITLGVSIGRFITMVYVANATPIYILCTAELCVAIIIVSMTALRPLLRKITGIVSTKTSKSGSGNERENKPGYQSSIPPARRGRKVHHGSAPELYWRNNNNNTCTHHSNIVATSLDDSNGSEVELNSMAHGEIRKTEEVSIVSERISIDGKPKTSIEEEL